MRFITREQKNKKRAMVDHPETGELVFWKDLSVNDRRLSMRNYFKERLDAAYNEILYDLLDPDDNEDDHDIAEVARYVGERMLKIVCGLDPDATRDFNRQGFPEMKSSSSLKNKLV